MSDINKTELKKCPFCGGEAGITTKETDQLTYIRCSNCGVATPLYYAKVKAIEAWNTRIDDKNN